MIPATVTLSGGLIVPYPRPTSAAASAMGKGNKRSDNRLETAVRSALHRRGLRFRKDFPVRAGEIRVRPDVVFTRAHVAVFLDGCFWHSCPDHQTSPTANRSYWGPKLAANRARDLKVTEALSKSGWRVIRLWEHEPIDRCVEVISGAVRAAAAKPVSGRR